MVFPLGSIVAEPFHRCFFPTEILKHSKSAVTATSCSLTSGQELFFKSRSKDTFDLVIKDFKEAPLECLQCILEAEGMKIFGGKAFRFFRNCHQTWEICWKWQKKGWFPKKLFDDYCSICRARSKSCPRIGTRRMRSRWTKAHQKLQNLNWNQQYQEVCFCRNQQDNKRT